MCFQGPFGLLVCGFLVFGFLVSKIVGFLVSQFPFKVFGNIWSMLQNFHVMFLIDIDPISKILNISLDGSSSFFDARLFGNCQNAGFPEFEMYKNLF